MISVVIPVFNEEKNIPLIFDEIKDNLSQYGDFEILYVDDGSSDLSLEKLQNLKEQYPNQVKYISFSKNFGHQNAMMAGVLNAKGDTLIMMDGDFQHPPELLPTLIEKSQEGFDVVNACRDDSKVKTGFAKKSTSKLYYKIFSMLSGIKLAEGSSDFRLLTSGPLNALREINEYDVFIRGMIPWIGFNQATIKYTPKERRHGESKFTLKKMLKLAKTGILSFSTWPLYLSVLIGLSVLLIALIYSIYILYIKFFTDQFVQGWASILFSVLFLGATQLLFMGIFGLYMTQILENVKKRPRFLIKEMKL